MAKEELSPEDKRVRSLIRQHRERLDQIERYYLSGGLTAEQAESHCPIPGRWLARSIGRERKHACGFETYGIPA